EPLSVSCYNAAIICCPRQLIFVLSVGGSSTDTFPVLEDSMLKRLFFTALSIAALTYSASAANALPAASGGQTFYVSTSLSDSVGKPADPTIYNIGGNTYFKLRDLGRLLDFGVTYD